MTILSNKIAERENLELHQTNIPRPLTATGQRMHVNGKIDLELTSAWQKGRIEVLVLGQARRKASMCARGARNLIS